jgi:hypothetical protein
MPIRRERDYESARARARAEDNPLYLDFFHPP